LLKIEEDGKSWLRRPKLYKGVVDPYKKKKKTYLSTLMYCNPLFMIVIQYGYLANNERRNSYLLLLV